MTRAAESPGNSSAIAERVRRCRWSIPAITAAAVLSVASSSPQAQANCQDLLGSDIYRCRVKSDSIATFPDCFRFTAPETPSPLFALFSDVFTDVLACACQAKGTFRAPEFGAAKSFHCVSPLEGPYGLAVAGAVKKKGRVIEGQAVDDVGSSFMFRCTRAQSCSLPLSPQGLPADSW